jgi:shikimate kinase
MFIKNISLIGFMGCGKSTIGKILANDLKFIFLDLDNVIEYIIGLNIREIFEKYGEDYFRNLESDVIKNIYHNSNCVFACGGGVFKRHNNIKEIRQNSFVVYLSMTLEKAYERLKFVKDRPLLITEGDLKEKIAQIMDQRKEIYENNCDLKIEINNKSPDRIKEEIIDYLNKH